MLNTPADGDIGSALTFSIAAWPRRDKGARLRCPAEIYRNAAIMTYYYALSGRDTASRAAAFTALLPSAPFTYARDR